MRWSQTFVPTLKETPADAEIPSHKLLLRAGLIRKLTGGLYTFMPLGLRALRKVEQIVREEMDRAGAMEVLMPALHDIVVKPLVTEKSSAAYQNRKEYAFVVRPEANKYQIRLLLIEHLSHSNQQSRGQLIEGLVGQHQIEIMIRRDREKSQYLVQDTPMLRGHADTQVQSAAPSQFGDHRRARARVGQSLGLYLTRRRGDGECRRRASESAPRGRGLPRRSPSPGPGRWRGRRPWHARIPA